MTANKMPVLPEANVRFVALTHDIHFADSVEVPGETLDLYTADQMRAMYLAGLEAAKACVGEAVTYTDLKGPEPHIPEHNAYNRGVAEGMNGRRTTILTNLTALEQEAKK